MAFPQNLLYIAASAALVAGLPTGEPSLGPIPGQTSLYNDYAGKAPQFPGNVTGATLPTINASTAPNDLLFQNLLSAEWIVSSFYQQGVEAFNSTTFTDLGYPNTTYDRIVEIRDNEMGHLNAFYREISNASIKPGPCKYDYGFSSKTPVAFLALQVLIEVSSMAFLSGLIYEAQDNPSRAALLAIAEVETRHTVWALIDVLHTNPFSGPADTVFPYAHEILQLTNQFVVDGSCPAENPPYPYPNQDLPTLGFNSNSSSGHPGAEMEFTFPGTQPHFDVGCKYYAVFFHGLYNLTVPFDPQTPSSTVPAAFDANKGIIIAVIANEAGAPTVDTVVAGPLVLIQQPAIFTQSDS